MLHFDNGRHQLLELAQEQSLSQEQYQKLSQWILPRTSVKTQQLWLQRVLIMLGGMCLGLALIFWVAANWDNFSLTHKFILAESVLGVSLLLGCLQTRARQGLLLLSVLALGGLLALYAQEYSTNSGPWRLFAIWALMALPIALATKHQAVWLFWWLIVLIAASLWWGQKFDYWNESNTYWVYLVSIVLWGLAVMFYPRGFLQSWLGGAPQHMFRWAISSTFVFSISIAWVGFFWESSTWVLFSLFYLAMLAGTVYTLYRLHYIDKVILAVASLGLNAILVGSWVRCFMEFKLNDLEGWIFVTFTAGALSLFLLILCVKQIKKISSSEPFVQELNKNTVPEVVDNDTIGGVL